MNCLAVDHPQRHLGIRIAPDNNSVNRPHLPSIHRHEVARRVRRSKRLIIRRICAVHDDLGVEVFVTGNKTTRGLLTFDRCAPALGVAALCKRWSGDGEESEGREAYLLRCARRPCRPRRQFDRTWNLCRCICLIDEIYQSCRISKRMRAKKTDNEMSPTVQDPPRHTPPSPAYRPAYSPRYTISRSPLDIRNYNIHISTHPQTSAAKEKWVYLPSETEMASPWIRSPPLVPIPGQRARLPV